jgi:hypothetical protein
MRKIQTLSKRNKLALSFAALALLVGSGIAYADIQHVYTSDFGFQVVDPNQPNISTSVTGSFSGQPIQVYVNMSSQEGVGHLKGTYSVFLQLWNDTKGGFVNVQTLASNVAITLTPTPVTLHYTLTAAAPGDYNVHVEFTAISATSG